MTVGKLYLTLAICTLALTNALFENEFTKIGADVESFIEGVPSLFRVYQHRDNEITDVVLRFYSGRTLEKHVDIKLPKAEALLTTPGFDKTQPTVFYIHGYKENVDTESIKHVVSSYFKAKPETNVILVDWSNMAFGSYFVNAAPNTRKVAHGVAVQLKKLIDMGLDLQTLHIVGHSLGGQTAGFIGKEMKNLDITMKRISALDPAFPMFYPGLVLNHISSDDAEYVDVIHTNAGAYGAPVSTGTADFWPNKESHQQPGCPPGIHLPMSPEDLCSHWRSWEFWAESVINPTSFPAASSHNSKVVYMGIQALQSGAIGEYVLTTNDRYPFGRGMDGIVKN